mgnify:CR=1 FL=1
MNFDEQPDADVELSYQLLKRYMDLGCTLNEALTLTSKTLKGECVFIRTGINEEYEKDDDTYIQLLFEYLFGDNLGEF